MANTLTLDGPDGQRVQEREKIVRYKVVLTGNYVQAVRGSNTVGEVLDLTRVIGVGGISGLWGPNGPKRAYVINGIGGFGVQVLPGADNLHWLLKFFSTTPGVELAAGAYPAPVTADVDAYIEFSGRPFD